MASSTSSVSLPNGRLSKTISTACLPLGSGPAAACTSSCARRGKASGCSTTSEPRTSPSACRMRTRSSGTSRPARRTERSPVSSASLSRFLIEKATPSSVFLSEPKV
jgi:hypothetical protein